MKIYISQLNFTVGDLEGNCAKILRAHDNAMASGADFVITSEMSSTGYPPRDLLFYRDYQIPHGFVEKISIDTLIGGVSKINNKLYNSAFHGQSGRIKQVIHKKCLPNYEVFNENRYFDASTHNTCNNIIQVKNKNIAVFICEDMLGMEHEFSYYACNPIQDLSEHVKIHNKKLDAIICIAASPFRAGQLSIRIDIAKKISKQFACPICIVNQVGAHDELLFDGSSFVVSEQNIQMLPSFVEHECLIDLAKLSHNMYEQKITDALVMGIKDYFMKTSFQRAIIGLSGGIDSAVVACLAVKALGNENVFTYMMPSKYSSEASLDDAIQLANNLNVKYEIININDILESFMKASHTSPLTLNEENFQSRIRGSLLMAKSQEFGGLVLTTSNKSELAMGYFTMYGDSCGALAPIGDLWKMQIYEIARQTPEIPENIICKAPSAELRPNQKDSDTLPEYALLEPTLDEIIMKKSVNKENINMYRQFMRNEFKRKQCPIILKVSSQSLNGGCDWCMPIACKS